jgi:hypothetical protein
MSRITLALAIIRVLDLVSKLFPRSHALPGTDQRRLLNPLPPRDDFAIILSPIFPIFNAAPNRAFTGLIELFLTDQLQQSEHSTDPNPVDYLTKSWVTF